MAPGAVVSDVACRADVCPGPIYRWRKEQAAPAGFAEMLIAPAVTMASIAGTTRCIALSRRFAKTPANIKDLHRPLRAGVDLDDAGPAVRAVPESAKKQSSIKAKRMKSLPYRPI